MEQSPSKELYPLIKGSKTSLATREQLSSILAYLDYDQIVSLYKSETLDPNTLAVVGGYNLYWKERVEHWFGVTLSDYKVDWLKVYNIVKDRERDNFIQVLWNDNYKIMPPEIWLDGYRKETSPAYVDILNRLLLIASKRNYINVVSRLLSDSRVDPSYEEQNKDMFGSNYINKSALAEATGEYNLEIVDMLLNDGRANLFVKGFVGTYSILSIAAGRGANNIRTSIVKRLIKDPRTAEHINEGLVGALDIGIHNVNVQRWDLIDWLLNNTKADPSIQDNKTIIYACADGPIELVKILLKDSRVNPADKHNDAIIAAAEYNKLMVLDLLLQDSRVDPTDTGTNIYKLKETVNRTNLALKLAIENKHKDIVRRLIKDERIRQMLDNDSNTHDKIETLLGINLNI